MKKKDITALERYDGNHFIFYCDDCEVEIVEAVMLQSNLRGMCTCMYLIVQCSTLQDDVV